MVGLVPLLREMVLLKGIFIGTVTNRLEAGMSTEHTTVTNRGSHTFIKYVETI